MNGYGFAAIAVGMILFVIGGLIDFSSNHQRYNDEIQDGLRIFRKNPLTGGIRVGVDISNKKAMVWCVPGMIFFILGIGMIAFDQP